MTRDTRASHARRAAGRPRLRALVAAAFAVLVALGPSSGDGAAAQERPVAIVNAEIHAVSAPPIARGTLVMHRGRIVAVGASVAPPADAAVVDVAGARVLPGFVDPYTPLGLEEIPLSPPTVDAHEGSGPLQPHLRVIDALDLRGRTLARAAASGVLSAHSVPKPENVVGGVTAAWRVVRGALLPDVVLKVDAALHVSLGEKTRGYGARHIAPMTRMGAVAIVREAFAKARDHAEALARATKEGTARPAADLKSDLLLRVLRKELPMIVRADRADDILAAARLADEFNVRLILAGASQAWRVAPILAQKKIPVIVAPVRAPPDRMERQGARLDNAAILHRAGVVVAIGSDDAQHAGHLPFEAGFARARGLPPEIALRAITLTPAEVLGVASEVGSLEPGKRADVLVVRGDPMEPRSQIEAVYAGGIAVDLRPWERGN